MNYTFAYLKSLLIPNIGSDFSYVPFTVKFSATGVEGNTGTGTIKFEPHPMFIQMLEDSFSMNYRIISGLSQQALDLMLTAKQIEDSYQFFDFNVENEKLINNEISIDIKDDVDIYVQLFASTPNIVCGQDYTPFGHFSFTNTTGSDVELIGHLNSLFNIISDQNDLVSGYNNNITLAGLFADNNVLNFASKLELLNERLY